MPGPSPIVKARIPPALRAGFLQLASARGLTESELLRTLIQREVSGDTGTPGAEIAAPGQIETERMTVRMRVFLMETLKQRAKAQGLAPSRWVAALVQSNLTKQPVLTDFELQAVLASNRELSALGRNLNQVAKALNEAFHETDRVHFEMINELAETVKRNRAAILGLVRASRNVWSAANAAD